MVDARIWAASWLLLGWKLWLGAYSVGFFFFYSSQLCCLLRFQNSPQTHLWEGFLLCGNFSSFMTPSPGELSIPNSFVSRFVFYILSYILSKRMGCLSGYLESSASVQKLYCGNCSAFKWSFEEFVGRKWSPCPIPSYIFIHPAIFCFGILAKKKKSVKFIIQIHLNRKYSLIVPHSLIVFFKTPNTVA